MSFQSIRRAVIASGLVIGAAAAFSPAAFADTVNLSGTVTSTLALTTSPTAGPNSAANLPLNSATEQIVRIADLAVSTNNNTGYTLTVSSGSLTKSGGADIPFQVVVTDDGTAAASGDFTVASGTAYTYSTASANAAGSNGKDLSMKFTPDALQDPGNYTASVSVTVVDK
ncbi:hypothetical protein Cri9333_1522 [Crinalium epipsammum PCC 9333]|uniref:Uncharacterized protein n=1 Tax=Crinalium epipsammum PCC 9333 TaxID=1173022 RepID=K9VXZ2_9CYAN|nr:hypothetical protein [Crinalium epipsammum]AFZ12414.1 hypothetical protein Cri9333_1522 [Crinalium epipsammum PCC 9333]